jgi:hypothetical protein
MTKIVAEKVIVFGKQSGFKNLLALHLAVMTAKVLGLTAPAALASSCRRVDRMDGGLMSAFGTKRTFPPS